MFGFDKTTIIGAIAAGFSAFITSAYIHHQINLQHKDHVTQYQQIYARKLGEYCGSFGYEYKSTISIQTDRQEVCTKFGQPDLPIDIWYMQKIIQSAMDESKNSS